MRTRARGTPTLIIQLPCRGSKMSEVMFWTKILTIVLSKKIVTSRPLGSLSSFAICRLRWLISWRNALTFESGREKKAISEREQKAEASVKTSTKIIRTETIIYFLLRSKFFYSLQEQAQGL